MCHLGHLGFRLSVALYVRQNVDPVRVLYGRDTLSLDEAGLFLIWMISLSVARYHLKGACNRQSSGTTETSRREQQKLDTLCGRRACGLCVSCINVQNERWGFRFCDLLQSVRDLLCSCKWHI